MINNNNDFKLNGTLRTSLTFRWIGEISVMGMRNFTSYNQDGTSQESWALDITDCFGWRCSFFRRGEKREAMEIMMAQLPYRKTLVIEGEVAIRKGNSYFNAKKVLWPNGEPFQFSSASPGEPDEECV